MDFKPGVKVVYVGESSNTLQRFSVYEIEKKRGHKLELKDVSFIYSMENFHISNSYYSLLDRVRMDDWFYYHKWYRDTPNDFIIVQKFDYRSQKMIIKPYGYPYGALCHAEEVEEKIDG